MNRAGRSMAMNVVIGVMAVLIVVGIILAFVRPELLDFGSEAGSVIGDSFSNISSQIGD